MKKFIGKSAAIAAAALLFAQSVPMMKVDAAGDNKLTIKSYLLDASSYENAKANEASGVKTDDEKVPSSTAVKTDLGYKMYPVNDDGVINMTNAIDTTTNSDGVATFENIETGTYWVDPIDPKTNPAFSNADGFFVSFTGSSDIYVYPKFVDNGYDSTNPAASNAAHTVEFTKKGKDPGNEDVALDGVKYKVYFKNMKNKWEAAKNESGEEQIFITNGGKITIPGLPLGDYYFVEQDSDSTKDNKITIGDVDYLVDQTPKKVTISPEATGKTEESVVNDRALTVTKRIAGDAAGDKFNWIIEADVPSNASNLLSYNIYDNYNASLSGITVTKVTTGDGDANVLPENAYSATNNNSDKITVSISELSKLSGKSKVYVYVESKVGTGENLNELTNNTSIDYKYAYKNPDADPDDDGYCDDVTPKVPFIPDIKDPDGSYPAAISVDPPTDNETPSAEVELCTFTISNIEKGSQGDELSDAKYQIKNESGANIGSELTDTSDKSDKVEVKNLAPGKYQVVQTAVGGAKHKKATNPIIFWVDEDGKIYPEDEDENKSNQPFDNNVIVFENDKTNDNFNLPFTGTTATRVFTITGICVMLAAGIFIFILLKKKDEDEEENKG